MEDIKGDGEESARAYRALQKIRAGNQSSIHCD